MTNQEAIKELDKLVVGEISDSPRLEKEHKTRNKALTVAIEALKQAEKYKWHDLRKNPDDLPEINCVVICECKSDYGTTAHFVMWHTGKKWLWQNRVPMFKIIAWKYIEPFEVYTLKVRSNK